jgi:5-methylcytosine-specific restriction endonuclease McrA
MIQDADIFEAAVHHVLDGRQAEASARLLQLPAEDPVLRPPKSLTVMSERPPPLQPLYLTPAIRAQVFASDNWCCRYCARKLVHPGILLLLGEIFPEFRGLKSGHHMPKETTEPAVVRVYPEVDHVNAVSLGGTWRDLDNLVAACTPCNELKNNYLGWTTIPRVTEPWSGLTEYYRPLAKLATRVGRYHVDWMRVLGV